MASDNAQNLVKKMTELDEITKYFDQEEVDIDEAIKKYEAGVELAKEIKEKLRSYELKIQKIKAKYAEDEQVGE